MRILKLISVLSLTILTTTPLFAAAQAPDDLYGGDECSPTLPLTQASDYGEDKKGPPSSLTCEQFTILHNKAHPLLAIHIEFPEFPGLTFSFKGLEVQSAEHWVKLRRTGLIGCFRLSKSHLKEGQSYEAWYEAASGEGVPLEGENYIAFSVICRVAG